MQTAVNDAVRKKNRWKKERRWKLINAESVRKQRWQESMKHKRVRSRRKRGTPGLECRDRMRKNEKWQRKSWHRKYAV